MCANSTIHQVDKHTIYLYAPTRSLFSGTRLKGFEAELSFCVVPYRRKRLVLDHIGLGQEAATLMKTLIVGFKIIQDEGCTLLFFSPDSFVSELFHA